MLTGSARSKLEEGGMDHDSFVPDSEFGTFSDIAMDLDVMDGVMFQGYWIETTDKFTHLEAPSSSSFLCDPEQYLPCMEPSHLWMDSHLEVYQAEIENSPENPLLVYPEVIEHIVETKTALVPSEDFPPQNSQLGLGWWLGSSCSVKDRLILAIEYMKEYVEGQVVLIQIWVPTEMDGKSVLTTVDQPYSLNPNCKSLASYRNVSKTFLLAAEEDSTASAGLPGRVFLGKFPEWTPDVRFFRSDECPRKNYAKLYNISGCIALPVFDTSGACLAVVEIVTTAQKISYHLEVESVYKALEAVDLKSSLDFCPPGVKACSELYQVAVPELLKILQSVCRTYSLPLAQTWAPCAGQDRSGYHQFAEKYPSCISTVNSACFVADEDFLDFHVACSEQILFPDQGIVGKAFTTTKQCFATDITSFSKTDYPLSHHARMFSLRAAVAIPLRGIRTGSVEYVLELLFPKDCRGIIEQKQMWDLLSISIKQACRSLYVITDKDLEEAIEWQMEAASDGRPHENETQTLVSSPSKETSVKEATFVQAKEESSKCVSWECPKQEPEEECKVITHWDDSEVGLHHEQFLDFGQLDHSGSKSRIDGLGDSYFDSNHSSGIRKASEKRRTKTEKTISLQLLRQYFAGSLKDAAKSIGVCPTTLKRICRQYGIARWPSRKIKKVNHSLRKLQLVVDSVEGAKGLIQVDSFYTIFPGLSSSNASGSGPFSSVTMSDNVKEKSRSTRNLLIPEGTDSKSLSSSIKQNSGLCISCSTGAKQLANNTLSSGDALVVEDPVAVLRRTWDEAEFRSCTQEDRRLLSRSQHPSEVSLQPLPKCCDRRIRDETAFRVKATFAEENIRFSLLPNWSFRDLQQEIAKRFNIDDFSRIDLKYLDNDGEPILLACDADLEECKDIFRFSPSHIIKMSLCLASQPSLGSSFSSRSLY